jgi:hypothetical protein
MQNNANPKIQSQLKDSVCIDPLNPLCIGK